MAEALSGLKVIEYADYISGPFCAKLMSDFGADVVKIEAPGSGDCARRNGPFPADVPHPEKSGLFLALNVNKRGITLDPTIAAGAQVLKELVKKADVLIENQPPSAMEKLGFGYETLKRLNPQLIMTSITPFGQSGPYAHFKGNDLVCTHMSGLAYHSPFPGVNNLEDNPPLKPGGHQSDFVAGSTAATATMFAIISRERIDAGQHLDISQHEAITCFMRRILPMYTYDPDGMYREWCGSRLSNRGGTGYLPCLDGFVVNGCREEYQWRAFLELVAGGNWEQDERLGHLFKNGFDLYVLMDKFAIIRPVLIEWTMKHPKEEIAILAQAKGIPIVACNSADALFTSPQYAEREFFLELEHPVAGKLRYPGLPYKFSGTPPRVAKPAPLLGQHNEEILGGWLDYPPQKIAALRQAGAI